MRRYNWAGIAVFPLNLKSNGVPFRCSRQGNGLLIRRSWVQVPAVSVHKGFVGGEQEVWCQRSVITLCRVGGISCFPIPHYLFLSFPLRREVRYESCRSHRPYRNTEKQ